MKKETHPVIGMSPGNSYFKEDKIKFLLNNLLMQHSNVTVMVADVPAISTYVALGYPENRARTDKTIRNSNQLKNRVKRVLERNGIPEDKVRIIDWKDEVETDGQYLEKYESVKDLYNKNSKFRDECNKTTRLVLENKG